MKTRALLIIFAAVALLNALGCGAANSNGASGGTGGVSLTSGSSLSKTHDGPYPYNVACTVGMVTDIVRQVAGPRANVVGLLGEDVDPHTYKPTRDTVQELLSADVVFYNGLLLEGRMGDTFAKVSRTGKPVFAVTEALDDSYLREPPEFRGHYDPHVWMDVAAWSRCVKFVADSLSQYDPAGRDEYQANAAAYCEELTKLDAYVREAIGTIPEEQRVLITAHDAFGYFSQAYKIPVRSPQGITTESQPSLKDINDLVDFIVEHKVKAIFVESSVNPKSIEAIVAGAASRKHKVTIGGKLFSDAMGRPGTYEGTYIGMMDHNATTIARALGGKVPERGLNGKLSLK
ncbi:MAG: zinc ABC transporter substrate-binding protein [Planctomycetia bacterium]|nr:zinc ABC transporter substrate-binding protein [Planctomycetia bacterium]